jgi:hypothetical protein
MDALDESGAHADDLFIRYVFPPERESEIRDRRTARDRASALSARAAAEAPELSQEVFNPIREQLANWEFAAVLASLDRLEQGFGAYLQLRDQIPALRAAAEQAGLPAPYAFEDALKTWAFQPFFDSLADFTPAIEAYTAAEQKLSEPRSITQQLGLIGRRPESHLEAARGNFAASNFRAAIDDSHAAEAALADANSLGLRNAGIGAAVLVLLVISAFFVLRWISDELRTSATASERS